MEEVTGLVAWGAVRRLADLPHLLFLDSAQIGKMGRYSFVTADPVEWYSSDQQAGRDPFVWMREVLHAHRLATIPGLPPFQGGLAGLWGYGLGHWIEKLPRPRFDEFRVPDLALGLYDWVLAWDHHVGRAWLISTGLPARGKEREGRARARLEQVKRWLDRPNPPIVWKKGEPIPIAMRAPPSGAGSGRAEVWSNFDEASYLQTIRRAIDYIHAGDCFQVNVAQRLLARQDEPALALYERLRQRNAAPFAGYFDLGDFVLASASPERFLRLERGEVETRPIKGTRPRGTTPVEDMFRAEELRTSAKDRAENVMIIDLVRNDLGRVCAYGTVRVEAVCRLESYRFVHHLVSEVRGRLREGLDAVDLFKATFPGGSVTGAPKIRAMEIITELEQVARGAYCGCLGYVGFDGSMDTNLLIRTFTLGKGWVQFSVGGGIVADSEPRTEYEETWHKAEGMLRALGE